MEQLDSCPTLGEGAALGLGVEEVGIDPGRGGAVERVGVADVDDQATALLELLDELGVGGCGALSTTTDEVPAGSSTVGLAKAPSPVGSWGSSTTRTSGVTVRAASTRCPTAGSSRPTTSTETGACGRTAPTPWRWPEAASAAPIRSVAALMR